MLTLDDYKFCSRCNGLYRIGKNFKQHVAKFCSQLDEDVDDEEVFNSLEMARKTYSLALPSTVSESVVAMVSVMVRDDITAQVKQDNLILHIGYVYGCRIAKGACNEHIRQRMRLLARVCLLMENVKLAQVLLPHQFGKLCEMVKDNFVPSAQIKLGIFLKNAMELLHNIAIRKENTPLRKAMKASVHLISTEWKHIVGHQALLMTEQVKFNKVDILPISRDVLKVRTYLDEQVQECVTDYENDRGDAFRSKRILGCKATVFNKRRGSEFMKSTRKEIEEAIKVRESQPRHAIAELDEQLSPIEKALSEKMKLLTVKGKQGKGVAVLLEPNDWSLLNYILNDPKCATETYLFQNRNKNALRGHDVLSKLADTLDLEKKHAMRYVIHKICT